MKFCLLTFFLAIYINSILSQVSYPKNYFASPVKNGFVVLSNFGDIRSNHFHTGIDLHTGEGNPVICAADGYVSRVKVSPVGYGKAVYITHPNGFTTVYAHLKSYSDKIDSLVKHHQYLAKDFAVEFFPDSGAVQISQSELLGLSGNTGMSQGPHLHFEIRDTKSEHIINPLLFYDYPDKKAPSFTRIHIYPIDSKSSVNGKNKRQSFDVTSGKDGKIVLSKNPKITLSGKIGFAIEAFDSDGITNDKSNIYSVNILIDTTKIYTCRFEEFSFDDKRNVNSYIDYREYSANYKNIQRCFVEPNNKTPIYSNLMNNGIFDFSNDTEYSVSIDIADIYNHGTHLNFNVFGSKTEKEFNDEKDEYSKVLPYEDVNYFVKDDIMISFPENIFYNTVYFDYKRMVAGKGYLSAIHHIHNKLTPLNKKIIISIKMDQVPQNLSDKCIIASISPKGKLSSIGGQKKDNYLTSETFDFGRFSIVADTIAPDIKPLNIKPNEDLRKGKTIKFRISDNLSGVKSYSGYIDGNWVIFEFDKKTDTIVYFFDNFAVTNETHHLTLTVEDEKGNKSSTNISFFR